MSDDDDDAFDPRAFLPRVSQRSRTEPPTKRAKAVKGTGKKHKASKHSADVLIGGDVFPANSPSTVQATATPPSVPQTAEMGECDHGFIDGDDEFLPDIDLGGGKAGNTAFTISTTSKTAQAGDTDDDGLDKTNMPNAVSTSMETTLELDSDMFDGSPPSTPSMTSQATKEQQAPTHVAAAASSASPRLQDEHCRLCQAHVAAIQRAGLTLLSHVQICSEIKIDAKDVCESDLTCNDDTIDHYMLFAHPALSSARREISESLASAETHLFPPTSAAGSTTAAVPTGPQQPRRLSTKQQHPRQMDIRSFIPGIIPQPAEVLVQIQATVTSGLAAVKGFLGRAQAAVGKTKPAGKGPEHTPRTRPIPFYKRIPYSPIIGLQYYH